MLVGFWCIRHFWLHFSLSGNFFHEIDRIVVHACNRKHNSQYSHEAFLIKNLTFWTSERPESTPCWWWFSALSLCPRSFPLLSHPCLPIGTSKNVANVHIIATAGLLGRLQWCLRCNYNDILMFPTPCWWDFDISDIILAPFFTFQTIFLWFSGCAPRSGGKHNSEYSHKA